MERARQITQFLKADDQVFGHELCELLREAGELLETSLVEFSFKPEAGMIACLLGLTKSETDGERRYNMKSVANRLAGHFVSANPDNPQFTDCKIHVDVSPDGLTAFLTMIPPRGNGDMPTMNQINEVFSNMGLVADVDGQSLDLALASVREKRDIVWKLIVARGEPPVSPGTRKVRYMVDVIDKSVFRQDPEQIAPKLKKQWVPVKEGQKIGILMDAEPGLPGRDVFGKPIQPPSATMPEGIGQDVECSESGVISATCKGYVITNGDRIDVAPLYVMTDMTVGTVDLAFSGAVLVQGNVNGPGRIECDDLFITGNCEQMKVLCRGDVFIGGGIVGRHYGEVTSDGCIYCSFASEARLAALGEISVANAVINSDAASADIIRVTSQKGMIAGGKLQALKGVTAPTIGSEFGMLTEIVVGKDFLTPSRLAEIIEKIGVHEENLQRIQKLKQDLAKSRTPIERLPRDKQEIYIGVLRKEQNSQIELKSLMRRKNTLSHVLSEFVTASIRALDSIYPPSRVQILDEISDISQKLNAVTLRYGKQGIVVSEDSPGGKEDRR